MKYLSLCSGIEAATVAWHPLGWEAVAYSEIEKFPSQVLAHHYPQTPNLGDMTKFKEWSIESNVDLLVGGTPCQSFSVAGLRKGLDDPRGNLMLTYLAIADKYRPRWLVWENVPGVLSSNGGQDFGVFLGALGELGYGFAYRVLDAQYFGVAQRRRRVFVVGYLGDWRPAAAVLFERHSLSGNPAPSREKRKEVTSYTPSSIGGYSEGVGTLRAHGGDLGGGSENLVAKCLTRGAGQRYDFETEDLIPSYGIPGNWIGSKPENGGNATEPMHDIAPCLTKADQHGVAQPIAFTTEQTPKYNHDQALTLTKSESKHNQCVAQPVYEMHGQDSRVRELGDVCTTVSATYGTGGGNVPVTIQPIGFDAYNNDVTGDVSKTIDTGQDYHHVPNILQHMAVRRLTPIECERLQGFGDNYTDIQPKGKPTPDGPRYKALGNSMAVPVMAWIGQRIEQVEAICKQNK